MPERTTRETVTFLHPFTLTSVDEPMEPGSYAIETVEEMLEGPSFVGFRRLSTEITIFHKSYGAAARQVIEIDPAELASALARDKAQGEPSPLGKRGDADR